jgi:hypothetical protein
LITTISELARRLGRRRFFFCKAVRPGPLLAAGDSPHTLFGLQSVLRTLYPLTRKLQQTALLPLLPRLRNRRRLLPFRVEPRLLLQLLLLPTCLELGLQRLLVALPIRGGRLQQ